MDHRKAWGGNRSWRRAATQSLHHERVVHRYFQQGVDEVDYLARFDRAPTPTVPLCATA